MAKKPLGVDKDGVQKVMRLGDYFADSFGMFALNSISGLIGQLTYFYTDKVGMAAGAVATVFFLCKIVDAFTDVIMGNIVDHTKPGKEKYRPWLLRMMLPAAIVMVALFTVPANASEFGKLAYMCVTNLLLSAVIFTALSIPYSSLQVVRTNSQEERGVMGTWRAAAGYVSGMIISIGIIPITNALGGTQEAWIKFGVGFALMVILALLICWARAKETATSDGVTAYEAEEEEGTPFREAIGNLFRNRYWVMVLLLGLFTQVSYAISGASGAYYCKWIYGDDNLTAVLGAVGLIPTIVGFAVVGPMIKYLGVTRSLRVSFLLGAIVNGLRIVNPTSFVYNTVLGSLGTFATIPMMCLTGVLTAMAIDYNDYKYGRKMVGTSQAACSFGGKIGSGLGASLIGWCLALANYDGFATTLTPAVRQAIYSFSIYIPLFLFAAMFVIMMRFDLEAKLPEYRKAIEVRKHA